jgi:hypothetical protein
MWYAKGMRHRPQAHITHEICRYDRIVCNYQDPCSTRPTMLPVVLAAIHYWLLNTPSDAPPSPTPPVLLHQEVRLGAGLCQVEQYTWCVQAGTVFPWSSLSTFSCTSWIMTNTSLHVPFDRLLFSNTLNATLFSVVCTESESCPRSHLPGVRSRGQSEKVVGSEG